MTDQSRPQPVLDAVGEAAALATRVSAFAKGIGAVLVLLGITTESAVASWATVAGLVVVSGGELASYVYTRVRLRRAAVEAAAQVTPLAAPQDERGVELVPLDYVDDEPGRHAAAEDAGPP